MRTIAVKKKLKVSEYGVFDASGKSVAGEDEAGVYEAIGLRWMAPELRENRGEIEAAKIMMISQTAAAVTNAVSEASPSIRPARRG